jgi:hypothetical protein
MVCAEVLQIGVGNFFARHVFACREPPAVWVGGVASSRGEEDVMKALAEAGVSIPDGVLRVAGRTPGLVLQYGSIAQVGLGWWGVLLIFCQPVSELHAVDSLSCQPGSAVWQRHPGCITEMKILLIAAKFGPNVLFCMPSGPSASCWFR